MELVGTPTAEKTEMAPAEEAVKITMDEVLVEITMDEVKQAITENSRNQIVVGDAWSSLTQILESTITAMASISPESTIDTIKNLSGYFEDLEKLKKDIQEKNDSICASLKVEIVETK